MSKPQMYNVQRKPFFSLESLAQNFGSTSDACLLSCAILAVVEFYFGSGLYDAEVVLFALFVITGLLSFIFGVKDKVNKTKAMMDELSKISKEE